MVTWQLCELTGVYCLLIVTAQLLKKLGCVTDEQFEGVLNKVRSILYFTSAVKQAKGFLTQLFQASQLYLKPLHYCSLYTETK